MQTYVKNLLGLLLALLMAGCGNSSTTYSSSIISGITKTAISSSDIISSGATSKTFYIKNSDGSLMQFQFNSDQSATWGSNTGTWKIDNGNIVLTAGAITQTFSCIQKEDSYWLVFDSSSNAISRFYFDQALASAYNPAQMGGSIQGTALNLSKASITSIPYGSTTGVAGLVNGSENSARFNRPMSITTDGINYYVADYANHVIRKIDPVSGAVSRFAGRGTVGFADGAGLTAATFNQPTGITTDGTYLYVADFANHNIRQIDISTQVVKTIAGTALVAGTIDSTSGSAARFNFPMGITTDGTNLYVADYGDHSIRKVVISGTHAVSTMAGLAGHAGTYDGFYTIARFNLPSRITTDGSNLYVTDYGNQTIRKIAIASGVVSTLAGNSTVLLSKDGIGLAASFYHLGGITTDGTYLYVGDYNDLFINGDGTIVTPWRTYIRKVNIKTKEVTTIAGGDASVRITVPGTGNIARFVTPLGITTDGTSLLIANSSYHNFSLIK